MSADSFTIAEAQCSGAANPGEVFDAFMYCSGTCADVQSAFRRLCDALDVNPAGHGFIYKDIRAKINNWKAAALWKALDKRSQHSDYKGNVACSKTKVLVIGAGPCGLRAAIECRLLGARCVVVEKRDSFSRQNVLHLWPFVIADLKGLGAKTFFPQCCGGSIDHVSIRKLQYILLKVALLLGAEVYTGVNYEGLVEPEPPRTGDADWPGGRGWRASVSPSDNALADYEFDVVIGADGKCNVLDGFPRNEFRGKLAIAITANFVNHHTQEENGVREVGGVAYIFNQQFFKDMQEKIGVDLENIAYYKDETHYFVMTAKKCSLLQRNVIKEDHADPARLLADDNVNQQELASYARDAAAFATKYNLPSLEFSQNACEQPDVSMFDFTSLWAAKNASRIMERHGKHLLMGVVGDSLLEPFWPTGSGCARGFLSAFDTAWMIRNWASGSMTPLQVVAERESLYKLLSQTTSENLHKNMTDYSICPRSRYVTCNLSYFKPEDVQHLYDAERRDRYSCSAESGEECSH